MMFHSDFIPAVLAGDTVRVWVCQGGDDHAATSHVTSTGHTRQTGERFLIGNIRALLGVRIFLWSRGLNLK